MSIKKDELISASELARRLSVNPSYIAKKKKELSDAKCTYGKKFYYIKSCNYLGKDPDEPHQSIKSSIQKDKHEPEKKFPASGDNFTVRTPNQAMKELREEVMGNEDEDDEEEIIENNAKTLLEQIVKAVNSKDNKASRQQLDILKQKAAVLREYFVAKNEEIKNRKMEDSLFEKDEVIRILSFAVSAVTNSLINLPNNYAVALEGLSKKEIKDFVTNDTNRILEDLQNIGNKFE